MKYFIVFLFLLLSACTVQQDVEKQIETANYCNTPDDCVNLGSRCPFGCDILVNKNEADIVKRKLNALPQINRCNYNCVMPSLIECQENKCIPIYE